MYKNRELIRYQRPAFWPGAIFCKKKRLHKAVFSKFFYLPK